ncbi:E3 ubiquitin-protein ligase RNF216 [Marchantia polymorpha subsp. ruderalis]|nr:hypothetical protein MARPO_0001s0538 [Marchantia polymorpha]|eukprot:PTQ50644.1 hypothetical protein MARPO_0001s0538 [Marchantia polymorpha]
MVVQEDDTEWPEAPPSIPQEEDRVECGCCFESCAFDSMVQCEDGHLFCTICLRRHVENSIFGDTSDGGSTLCLAITGCERIYPRSEIRKCFSHDVWLKYERRMAEEAVAKAQLAGLVYCYHCNHPWEVDPGIKILVCINQSCLKETCLECKEPSHLPDPCRSTEKDPEDTVRTQVEESMTKAVIRVCSSCGAELFKLEGCNKIMCRCGQQMCYRCRESITDYSHFCPHIRAPQVAPCEECSMCCLWETEDVNKVVKAAKSAAIEKLAERYPEVVRRQIGPSEDPVRKRPCKERVGMI